MAICAALVHVASHYQGLSLSWLATICQTLLPCSISNTSHQRMLATDYYTSSGHNARPLSRPLAHRGPHTSHGLGSRRTRCRAPTPLLASLLLPILRFTGSTRPRTTQRSPLAPVAMAAAGDAAVPRGGSVLRQVLTGSQRTKLDTGDDREFYGGCL